MDKAYEQAKLTEERVYAILLDDLLEAGVDGTDAKEVAQRYATAWVNRPDWTIPAMYLSEMREEMLLNRA